MGFCKKSSDVDIIEVIGQENLKRTNNQGLSSSSLPGITLETEYLKTRHQYYIYLFICFYVNSFLSSFICFLFILLLLFHIVKSAIPHFPVSETVQLLQNDTQKYMLLRLMYYLGTTKWRLGKGTALVWGLLLRFIIVTYKKSLYFVVCCSFNGKMK